EWHEPTATRQLPDTTAAALFEPRVTVDALVGRRLDGGRSSGKQFFERLMTSGADDEHAERTRHRFDPFEDGQPTAARRRAPVHMPNGIAGAPLASTEYF